MYGPGIYLFFSSIWDMAILFLILSIIGLIPMIYNTVLGTTLIYSGSSLNVVAIRMTLGAHEYTSTSDYNTSIQHKLVNVISDIVSCVVFLAFYFYQVSKSARINKEIRK